MSLLESIMSSSVLRTFKRSSFGVFASQRIYHVCSSLQADHPKLVNSVQYLRTGSRSFSDDRKSQTKPPLLMKFHPVVKPEFLMTVKNWILAKFVIQPYLDNDFSIKEFTRGAKQALAAVSALLSQGDFQALTGLVSDEAVSEVQRNYSLLSLKQRQELKVKPSDILFTFPYQIGISMDDSGIKRFAEITVVYHCLKGLEEKKEIKSPDKKFIESTKDEITICNYRFIREYTKGVQGDWTVNRLGHFKLIHLEE